MKKVILVSIMLLCLTGCANVKKYESIMEDYSTAYYEKHMKGIDGVQSVEISISMLNKANEAGVGDYDLNKLKKCKNSSKVTLEINEDKSIKNYVYDLKCK